MRRRLVIGGSLLALGSIMSFIVSLALGDRAIRDYFAMHWSRIHIVPADSTAEWYTFRVVEHNTSQEFQISITKPGTAAWWGDPNTTAHVLLAGCGDNGGTLQGYSYSGTTRAWTHDGDYVDSQGDFGAVTYVEAQSRIYLLDVAQHKIVHASYTSGQLPTTWITLLDGNAWPPLMTMVDYEFFIKEDTATPLLRLHNKQWPEDMPSYDIRITNGAATIESSAPGSGLDTVSLTDDLLLPGASSVMAKGDANAPLSVFDAETGQQMGSGVIGVDETATISTLPLRVWILP